MSVPHDRPNAVELIDAVREWVVESLVDGEIDPHPFHARIAANMLAIAAREIELGPEHEVAHRARLARLGVGDDAELATAIRSGRLDDRADEVRELVWASVRDKLAVANPRHLERARRGAGGHPLPG